MWSYSPHRAIVALGAMLIVVAVAGGALGVASSGRAERAAALLTDRYLVLAPAVRQMQTSEMNFQLIVDQSFTGAKVTEADITSAADASNEVDRAYVNLERLLALPANDGDNKVVAPGLASAETTFITSRNVLADLLSVGTGSAKAAQIAATEQTAAKNVAAALGSLAATVNADLTGTAAQAGKDAKEARDGLLACLAIGVAFGIVITTVMARKAARVERNVAQRDSAQAITTRRNEFEGRLQRALEMAKAEAPVFDLVAQALSDAAPTLRSELLLADSSRAHFRQVLVAVTETDQPGCGVVSPDDCPAASRGQTMVFPLSTAMDACPNLKGRSCSALCVPVSIGGSSIGVVHVTAVDGTPPSEAVSRDVEIVVRRASERLAMLPRLRALRIASQQRLAHWPLDPAEPGKPGP